MMMPMTAGIVRYMIDFIPIVAVGGSFDDMYIDDSVEATPIIILLNVTISAGENVGVGYVVVVLFMVYHIVAFGTL